MKLIKINKQALSKDQINTLKSQQPNIRHANRIIDEESILIYGGKVVAVYKKCLFDISPVRGACKQLKFDVAIRNSGITTNTIHLNASRRNPRLDNKCWKSPLKRRQSNIHDVFVIAAHNLSKEYRRYFRRPFAEQVKLIYSAKKRVDENYRIAKTPFTGGCNQ